MDLLLGQLTGYLSLAHPTLRDQPCSQTQSRRGRVAFGDIQVSVLRVIDACFGEIVLPAGGKTGLQLFKQYPAIVHLLDDLEPLGHDLIALAVGIQTMDCFLHLTLQTGNTGQAFKVVDHIQDQGRLCVPCRQSTTNLLLVDDG